MKKLTISSALLVLVVLIISCTKDTGIVNRPSTASSAPTAALPDTHTVISNWFSLSFSPEFDRGEAYLQGIELFNSYVQYDKNAHVELAYVSMPVQRNAVIHRLPMRLEVPSTNATQNSKDDIYSFDFWLDNSGFYVAVKNVNDVTLTPHPANILDFTYRYIVIPRIVYDNLYIDWDNYDEVAQALNL